MTPLRWRIPVLAAVLLPLALPVAAQDGGHGGLWLRTDLSQRFELRRNADLDPGGEALTTTASTQLGMALSSETRTDRLALTFGASLRHAEGPDDDDDIAFGLKAPRAALRYSHNAGHASFQTGASLSVRDISYLETLTDLVLDEEGNLLLDDDGDLVIEIDERTGTGRRRQIGADAALRLGIGGPVEAGLSFAATATDYFDTGSGNRYTDSRSYRLNGTLGLQLAPGLRLNTGLGYRLFEEDGSDPRETWTLNNRLVRSLPRGQLSGSLNLAKLEEGTRTALSVGWNQPLPDGGLSFNLGATRAASGNTNLTGRFAWNRKLKDGTLSASLAQGVGENSDDEETRFTTAQANWSRSLTPLTGVTFGLVYARNIAAEGDRATRAEFSAGIRHKLSEDWSLNAGYRRIGARDDGEDWAQSDSLYLSVGRSFATRF